MSEVAQSCLTLCDPVDYSPPGSSVHGILQARILEWVAISFSRGLKEIWATRDKFGWGHERVVMLFNPNGDLGRGGDQEYDIVEWAEEFSFRHGISSHWSLDLVRQPHEQFLPIAKDSRSHIYLVVMVNTTKWISSLKSWRKERGTTNWVLGVPVVKRPKRGNQDLNYISAFNNNGFQSTLLTVISLKSPYTLGDETFKNSQHSLSL